MNLEDTVAMVTALQGSTQSPSVVWASKAPPPERRNRGCRGATTSGWSRTASPGNIWLEDKVRVSPPSQLTCPGDTNMAA